MPRRYSLWDEMRRMQEEMDKRFDSVFRRSGWDKPQLSGPERGELVDSNFVNPISDFWEGDNQLVAEIEMPGLNKDDIKVNVNDGSIEVKAETKDEKEDKKKGAYHFERNYSGYYRCFSLPKNVDPNAAGAEYKDGVLKVTVPKTQVEEKKQIDVK